MTLPPAGIAKMEDRKRHATHAHDDSGPPLKRQATTVNGGSRIDRDADMPWKDDLEVSHARGPFRYVSAKLGPKYGHPLSGRGELIELVSTTQRFQKDAIWRQMQEYKRERHDLEAQLNEKTKRAMYHDDHLRIVDAWWRQLLDEVRILIGDVAELEPSNQKDGSKFPPTLLFADNEKFQDHLNTRSQDIKSVTSSLLERIPQSRSPDVAELQNKMSSMLAAEKGHCVEIERLQAEKDLVEERLENASWRFMMAEKKLDRAKSAAVAKLERQAIFGGGNDSGSGIGGGEGPTTVEKESRDAVNGVVEHNELNADADLRRRQAIAVSEKQKAQLEKLETENEKLTNQVTTFTVKISNLSDEDYARSELFKHMKSQYEDVIKRINNLEATNIQLREEAEKLQHERSAYRSQIEVEVQAPVGDLENQLARAETDLARIRNARDELSADLAVKKSRQDQEQNAYDLIRDLASAREDRIKALESEVERLRLLGDSSSQDFNLSSDLKDLGVEELQKKLQHLQQEYSMISSELPSMGVAWKKASALASKKVIDSAAMEEKVSRLQAEKAKADQKYFATMKLKESREVEVKTLRAQNAKSAEIVAQLKDVEASTRNLLINLERQLAESKEALSAMTNQNRNLQQQITQCNITATGLKSQINELANSLKSKDVSQAAASKSQRHAETEAEQLRVQLEETEKSLESWKSKASGNQSEEFEMLRVSHSILRGSITVY
ncbi:MAG: E3 ubiquitin-protein ligase bre1 [Sclerophora amabilis]|nr:MAG: E3 ubiquitin-protein ligase bre1 [Sclerophora amabilis]